MKFNELGRTGIKVSEICLGTMTWGSQNSEIEAFEQMDYSVDQGVNFFDTAEMYPTTPPAHTTAGDTETMIGNWFAKTGKRTDIILATKVMGPNSWPSPIGDPISAKKVRESCEGSLQRMQTDYIDLYQLHWPNRGSYHFRQTWGYAPERQDKAKARADMEEIIGEIGKLVDEGKVRHFGLSNDTAWGLMNYLKLSEVKDLPRVASIQNEYSLMHRIFDTDLAEISHHEDVGLLSYTPLAAGLLTGKYADGTVPSGSRRSINNTLGGRVTGHEAAALDAYIDIAKRHGMTPTELSLAFCFTRPFMASVIIGATTMDQLRECIGAKDISLSDEVLGEIEEIYRKYPVPM
ncbi:MAG: aldo/keto reductase [Pseudomonadota bacterium]